MTVDATEAARAEPIDAEYEPTPEAAPERSGVSLPTVIGLSALAAIAGGVLGALADRAAPLAAAMDQIAPDALTHLREGDRDAARRIAELERQVAALEAGGGLKPETRAQFDQAVASVAAMEAKLAAWERGLSLLPGGPADFEPLRRRLAALESLPANPQLLRNEELARAALSLQARMATLEELTRGALAYEAAAARVSPVALSQRVEAVSAELSAVRERLDGAATAQEVRTVAADLARLQTEFTAIANEAMSAGEAARAAFAVAAATDAMRAPGPFPQSFATLQAALPDDPNVRALAPLASAGAPSVPELRDAFDRITLDIVRAARRDAAGGGPWGEFQAVLAEYVVVRRVGDEAASDVVERIRARLAVGDLASAVRDAERLRGQAGRAVAPWLADARKRLEIETRLAAIRAELARRG